MRLNSNNIDKFMKVVNSCQGPVYLTDWRVDKNDEPNFKLNLKSEISMFIGVSKLLGEYGDWFEIYAPKREDEAKIMQFMMEENQ